MRCASPADSTRPGSQTELTRPALLIIDDEAGIRDVLEFILTKAGFRVWTASSGEEGTNLCRHERVAIVFVDMVLPGKDGVETIMDIRRSFPEARIIAMSGGVNRETLDLARKVGAVKCLTKPFTKQGVLEAVSGIFNASSKA
jgi:DNA-binding response OmpR family regulator